MKHTKQYYLIKALAQGFKAKINGFRNIGRSMFDNSEHNAWHRGWKHADRLINP